MEDQTKGQYYAWNRTCAAMDRLEDTIAYLNQLELGKRRNSRAAFDFYDFINGKDTAPAFLGRYMEQYSWAEPTVGLLYSISQFRNATLQ